MTTAADLLTATNAAILKTLTSQEYNLPGGQRQRMAELRDLQALRQQLTNEVANGSDSNGSMCSLLSMGDAT